MTIGTLLARTFAVWRERFGAFAGLALAFQVATLLVAWEMGSPFLASGGAFGRVSPEAAAFVATGRYWAIVGISLGLWLFQTAAVTTGVLEHLGGRSPSAVEMLRGGFGRVLPLLAATLLAILAIWGGTLLLIVPGAILSVAFALTVPVVVVERLSPPKVLGRSRALTKGHRWVILGSLVLLYMAAAAPAIVVGFVGKGVPYLHTALGTLVNVVLGPLVIVLPAVAYHDLRLLKEGADTARLERVFE